jgi:hypothetical protein
MSLHPWWTAFGSEVADLSTVKNALARELVSLATGGSLHGVALLGVRHCATRGLVAVGLKLDVERPQDLVHDIRAVEPIAVVFGANGDQPSVISLRPDFPDTFHQNWAPPGGPYALCIDDRPWAEARLTASAFDIMRRAQLWLAKAARGDLHDPAQPPDPLFFGSQLGLILPTAALSPGPEPVELLGFIRADNQNLIITLAANPTGQQPSWMTVLALQAQPQSMARLRHAPQTLVDLAAELEPLGIQLLDHLKKRLKAWHGLGAEHVRRLSTRLAIVVVFPVGMAGQPDMHDVRAFLTHATAGDIGVALGVLHANTSDVGDKRAYMLALPEGAASVEPLVIEPAQVHFALDRRLAAAIAGRSAPDHRRVVMVGAGSLGSQVASSLAREGAFSWTIVDEDHLLPHNLARHALFAGDIGAPKAAAVAGRLSGLIGEPVAAFACNILKPKDEIAPNLQAALKEAEIIIDASASVAVSRHLSDLAEIGARRVCAFFNPAGNSVALLTESQDRSVTLRDLEAQYHRLVLSENELRGHLGGDGAGIRYTGSCRALTNRIPASNAAILSALAAKGIEAALADANAAITIWTLGLTGEVRRLQRLGAPVNSLNCGEWTVTYDAVLLENLGTMRNSMLPSETGGVLLGVVDRMRKSIHVAHALPPPEDSSGSATAFERGVENLAARVHAASAATMHQLRYVGEWHSHPDQTPVFPSATDCVQLLWLGQELAIEGLPGLMAIAGQDGRFAFAFAVGADAVPEA